MTITLDAEIKACDQLHIHCSVLKQLFAKVVSFNTDAGQIGIFKTLAIPRLAVSDGLLTA